MGINRENMQIMWDRYNDPNFPKGTMLCTGIGCLDCLFFDGMCPDHPSVPSNDTGRAKNEACYRALSAYLGHAPAPTEPPSGKTLRDEIAIEAMAAIIGKLPAEEAYLYDTAEEEMVARGAYSYADAMLREKEVQR